MLSTTTKRPTKARYCKSTVGSNAMVMDATIRFSYRLETNREALPNDERDWILSMLRNDILQSLVTNHCPSPGSEVGTRRDNGKTRRRLGLEVLSLHSSAAQPIDSSSVSGDNFDQCPITTSESKSCSAFSNDLLLLLDAANTAEDSPAELLAKVEDTIRDSFEDGYYTTLVNNRLEETKSDLLITAITYMKEDKFENVVEIQGATEAPVPAGDFSDLLLDVPRPSSGNGRPNDSETPEPKEPFVVEEEIAPTTLVLDPTGSQNPTNSLASGNNVTDSDTTTFVLAIVFGVLSLVLGWFLWRTCRKQNTSTAFSVSQKGELEKDSSVSSSPSETMMTNDENESLTLLTTVTTGEDSATFGPGELPREVDEDTLGSLAESSEDQDSEESASATFMTVESSYLMSSLPPPTDPSTANVMKVFKCESPPVLPTCAPCLVPGTNESIMSGRCESAACKACSSTNLAKNGIDVNDSQYLCPNFKLPGTETKKDTDDSNDVCIRVFEEDLTQPKPTKEEARTVSFDDALQHSRVTRGDDSVSRAIIPPSQVTQARDGVKIVTLSADPSFGYNSILASGSEISSVAETATCNKSVQGSIATISKAGSTGSSTYHMKRSLRPAKTVQL